MKKLLLLFLVLVLSSALFAASYVASTSWVASYMDLAGLDDVVSIAPSSLRHPPEYELKPSDVALLMNADLFCYAGYEGMMRTIGGNIENPDRVDIQINTGNSIENITKEVEKIASQMNTVPRLDEYVSYIEKMRDVIASSPIKDMKVLCHTMQLPLAQDFGLNVAGTFGPASPSAEEIRRAGEGDYDLIIDNVHNPVASPFAEVSDADIVVWRNFPERVGRNALLEVVEDNVENLMVVTE